MPLRRAHNGFTAGLHLHLEQVRCVLDGAVLFALFGYFRAFLHADCAFAHFHDHFNAGDPRAVQVPHTVATLSAH